MSPPPLPLPPHPATHTQTHFRVGRHIVFARVVRPCLSVTKSCPLCNLKTVQGIFMKRHININQQSARTVTLGYIFFQLCPFELCKKQSLWQNRVRSITLKPFRISSWNFIELLTNTDRRAERKNHNLDIYFFSYVPLNFVSSSFCDKNVSAL